MEGLARQQVGGMKDLIERWFGVGLVVTVVAIFAAAEGARGQWRLALLAVATLCLPSMPAGRMTILVAVRGHPRLGWGLAGFAVLCWLLLLLWAMGLIGA